MNIEIVLLFCCSAVWAGQQTHSTSLSEEERQRFLYYFYEANTAFATEQYDRAMALYQFAESINPNDAAVHHWLGTIYTILQQKEAGLAHHKKAYMLDPKAYWESLATTLYNDKRLDEAQEVLEEVYKQWPKDNDVAETLVTIYLQKGLYKKALKVQNATIRQHGEDAYRVYELYRIYLLMDKPQKGIEVLEKYLRNNPDEYQLQDYLARAYMATGQHATALAFLQAEIERHPDNIYCMLTLAQLYQSHNQFDKEAATLVQAILSESFPTDGRMRLLQTHAVTLQKAELLIPTLEQLIKTYPLEEDYYPLLATYYQQANNTVRAIETLHSLLAINPQHAKGWDMQLQILQEIGDSSVNIAIEHTIEGGYKAFPNEPKWCYYKGLVDLTRGGQKEVIHVLQHGLAVEETNERLPYMQVSRVYLGDLYAEQLNYDSAYYYYEEVLKRDPNHIYTLNNYAYFLAITNGDLKKAEKMSQITIQSEPDNATYLDTYAWILHLQGVESLAQFYIQKAVNACGSNVPEEITYHYNVIFNLPVNE